MSKELDIDWSTAPEGATQYAAGSNSPWEKVVDDVMYYWHSPPGWIKYSRGNPSYRRNLIYRPAEPQWDGSGMPPVGAVCEIVNMVSSTKGIIKCHLTGLDGTPLAVIQFKKGYAIGSKSEFRPIKSERDKALDEMRKVFKESGLVGLCDAGWRKP